MKGKNQYYFIGFNRTMIEKLVDNFHSMLSESSKEGDYYIDTAESINHHLGVDAYGLKLYIKARKGGRRAEVVIMSFAFSGYLASGEFATAIRREKSTARVFFCFEEDYLTNGFEGLEQVDDEQGNSYLRNRLFEFSVEMARLVPVATIIKLENGDTDLYKSIKTLQNEGREIDGMKFGLFHNEGKIINYRSFRNFLLQPVFILNNDNQSYKCLIA
jgi:hypothetical protein